MFKDDQESEGHGSQRILDVRVPLTWLVSGFAVSIIFIATLMWNVSVQNAKLEELVKNFSKLDLRLDQGTAANALAMREIFDLRIRVNQLSYELANIKEVVSANSSVLELDRHPSHQEGQTKMNILEKELTPYFQALLGSIFTSVIMPTSMLVILLVCVWVLFNRAQKHPGFNLHQVLLDEDGKVSSERVITVGTWMLTSWALVVVLLVAPTMFEATLLTYAGLWGGAGTIKAVFKNKYPKHQPAEEETTTTYTSTTSTSNPPAPPVPAVNANNTIAP